MSTSNKQLNLPVVGSTPGGAGGWGDQLDVNFNNIDSCLGSTLSLALSSSNVVLSQGTTTTPGQVSNLRIALTGTLLTNVNIIFPVGVAGVWLISNAVNTGAFTITLTTAGSGTSVILQNRYGFFTVYSDGTNMFLVDNATPPGMIQAFGGTVAPFGWLSCVGTSYPLASYPYLFASIGYTWGGSGANFNVPDLRGIFLRGSGVNGTYPNAIGAAVGTSAAGVVGSHTHIDSGHFHSTPSQNGSNVAPPYTAITASSTPQTGIATNVSFANIQPNQPTGTENTPTNAAVLYCIKT